MNVVRFSTHDLPPSVRETAMQDVYAAMTRIDLDRIGDAPMFAEGSMLLLPEVSVGEFISSPCKISRTPGHVAKSNDDWTLSIVTSGGFIVKGAVGGEMLCQQGDIYVMPNDLLFRARIEQTMSSYAITLPRAALEPAVIDKKKIMLRKLDPQADTEPRFLANYIRMLLEQRRSDSEVLDHMTANYLQDLAILALGGRRDFAEMARQRGLRAARLVAIKKDIGMNVASPELSVEWMAKRHNISPQYLRSLFYGEGSNFSAHVLEEKLQRAHRLLSDSRLLKRTVSAIAFESGFGDLSWFNQAFRRRFGMTPSDVRQVAKKRFEQ